MTDAAGRAAATALTPTASGAVQINVSATFQGQAATATITQTNFATAADAAKAGRQVQPGQATTGTVAAGSAGAAGAGAAAAGGGVSKLAVIGLVGGGAAGAAVAGTVLLRNTAPDVGAVTTSTSSAFLAHTPVTFQVQASDANDDSLSYAWDFGDGATATGPSPVHVFTNEGSYTVRVTVSDGKKSAASQLTVVIRTVNGAWRASVTASVLGAGPVPADLAFALTQIGSSVIGTVSLSFPTVQLASFPNCAITGSVGTTSPRIVLQQAPCPGVGAQGQPATFSPATFQLEPAQDVNTMTGPLGSQTITLTRQ
jgi:PKD repeat protein